MFTPDQTSRGTPAPCAEHEDHILDLLDGRLDQPDRDRIESHLTICVACRRYAQELRALDAALVGQFPPKHLPASFKSALLSRIDAAAANPAPELVAGRKLAIESEFRQHSTGLLKRVVRENWASFLDGAGLVALALVAAAMIQRVPISGAGFASLLAKALAQPGAVPLLWITGGAVFFGALWIGLREQLRRVFR